MINIKRELNISDLNIRRGNKGTVVEFTDKKGNEYRLQLPKNVTNEKIKNEIKSYL